MDLHLRNSYEEPHKEYDDQLQLTPEYTDSLPDMQDAAFAGAKVAIPHVGIHNFRLPLRFLRRKDYRKGLGDYQEVEASITGTVSLGADKKGINMSRIIRTFYDEHRGTHTIKTLINVVQAIMEASDTHDATLLVKFNYPIMQQSLRTNMYGWQYYDVCFNINMQRVLDGKTLYSKIIDFDFVYSSACPCSYELAEHARKYRNVATVSHSQRSVARVSILVDNDKDLLYIEDIQEMCVQALHTETQVMVKRPDEQAFAELNGTYTKFVEDAARQLYQIFDKHTSIRAFRVVCSHLESLHSHDAIAIVTKGDWFSEEINYHELRSLVK